MGNMCEPISTCELSHNLNKFCLVGNLRFVLLNDLTSNLCTCYHHPLFTLTIYGFAIMIFLVEEKQALLQQWVNSVENVEAIESILKIQKSQEGELERGRELLTIDEMRASGMSQSLGVSPCIDIISLKLYVYIYIYTYIYIYRIWY